MSEVSDTWGAAADLADRFAGIGYEVGRVRGVPEVLVAEMRAALKLLRKADPDAFLEVVVSDYAKPAADAVAGALRLRAEVEAERAMQKEPTNPNYVPPLGAMEETDEV